MSDNLVRYGQHLVLYDWYSPNVSVGYHGCDLGTILTRVAGDEWMLLAPPQG